jgi:hypothetical protein
MATTSSRRAALVTSGAFAVRCDQAAGAVHFVLDVYGYFQ